MLDNDIPLQKTFFLFLIQKDKKLDNYWIIVQLNTIVFRFNEWFLNIEEKSSTETDFKTRGFLYEIKWKKRDSFILYNIQEESLIGIKILIIFESE